MSSFFNFTRPKMMELEKKVLVQDREEECNLNDTPTNLTDSWVELAPSRNSLCSSDVGMVLVEDYFKEKDSRLSPVSMQSPHVEFEEQVNYKLVREMMPPGNKTDWMWDWSSRPEYIPPKNKGHYQYGSNVTTPPNSPAPELVELENEKESRFQVQLMFGFIVSNIFSFVVGAVVGIAICKKMVAHRNF